MTDTPDLVDVHVGARLRLIRKSRDCSQTDLADALGITFQQVQKYERGSNRLSASKMYAAAAFIGVPVGYFFEGLATTTDDTAEDARAAFEAKAVAVCTQHPELLALLNLTPLQQRSVAGLIAAMAA